jgi:phage-related protein
MSVMRGRIIKRGIALRRLKAPEISSMLAYAASLMLTGVPPAVCESVITEVYSSVKKSISSIIH